MKIEIVFAKQMKLKKYVKKKFSGGQLGTALQLVAAGFIANSWGWQAVFYSTGALGALWTVCYVFLGSDSPRNSRMIGENERNYIEKSLGHAGNVQKVHQQILAVEYQKV